MSLEQNKALIRRFVDESFNGGNLGIIDEVCAARFYAGAWRGVIARVHAWMPDAHLSVDDLVAEDNKVVLRWTINGTHTAEGGSPFGPVTPTGNQVQVSGFILYHLIDGRITGVWQSLDQLQLFQQLGVLPTPPAPS